MAESKNPKTDETKTDASPEKTSASKEPVVDEPVFTLERLRRECLKLFGVSTSTFDGATYKLSGEYTVEKIRGIIKAWQSQQILPTTGKESK